MSVIKKAKPLFREELKISPAAPMGSRMLVRPNPIADATAGGIVIPDEVKVRQMSGVVMAVGLDAAGKLYDRGIEIGDEIWYGKYAGIIEEWESLAKPGKHKCAHDGAWDRIPKPNTIDKEQKADRRWDGIPISEDSFLAECRGCGCLKLTCRVVVMDCEDVVCDVDLQVRIENGRVKCWRGEDENGRPNFYFTGLRDTFSAGIEPSKEAAEDIMADIMAAASTPEVVKVRNGRKQEVT